jgi:gliding motility-associated-like protein
VILQVAVQDADSLVAAVNFVKDVSCREANDGILDLNASGGTPGYRFSLDGVSYVSSDLFIGLSPRVDTAFVQDSAGCIVEVPFTIGQPDSVGYVVTVTPANTCNAATGTAVISNITGGQAPYQLSINGGSTFSDTTTFTGLTNGNYTLIIRDSVGCLYTSQFTIAVPGGLQLGVSQMIQPTCFGSNNGEIRIGNITGGARPYQFSIDGGLSFGNDSVFTNLISFVYTVVIRDANNCTYTYIYNLGQPSNINFNVNQQQPATCDSSNGSVIVTNVVGGITPYNYKIDYNGSTFQPSPIFTGLPGGNYQVTVQDATGLCEVTKLVVVAGNPGITFDFEVTDALCFGGNDGELKLFNIQGGLPPYRAGLDTSQNYLVVDQTNSVTFSNLLPGSYNYQIRDEDGCTYKLPPIEVGAPDSIGFMVRNVQLSRRDSAQGILYVFDINGGAEPYRYSIDGINYLPFEYSLSTFEYTAMIKNLRVGNYTVFVQDTNGCTNATRVSVQPYQFASRFEIPNVFTPNGDGYNETFVINRLPSNSKLKIFARNGRLVYSSEDYANDWDGEGWPNGVYFYSMTIPNLGDFTGWVEIKR